MNAITLKALFCISGVAVGGLLLFSSFETKATERWGIGSALVAESVEVALTRVAELGVEKMDLENSGVKTLKGNELTTEVPNAERLTAEQKAELSGAGRPAEIYRLFNCCGKSKGRHSSCIYGNFFCRF